MPSINFTYENRGFLTLMVGPSGAGKTTFCEKYFSDADARLPNGDANPLYLPNAAGTAVFIPYYISPDDIRGRLTGNPADQTRNEEVFELAHLEVALSLAQGHHVIFDATNLCEYSRIELVDIADRKYIQYIVLDRPNKKPWHGNMNVVSRHESLFQSELPRILAGDGFGGVHVIDLRNQFND